MSATETTIKVKWVVAKRYCDLTGDNLKSIYVRRSRGIWIDGVHAKLMPGIGLVVNMEEVQKWIETYPLE